MFDVPNQRRGSATFWKLSRRCRHSLNFAQVTNSAMVSSVSSSTSVTVWVARWSRLCYINWAEKGLFWHIPVSRHLANPRSFPGAPLALAALEVRSRGWNFTDSSASYNSETLVGGVHKCIDLATFQIKNKNSFFWGHLCAALRIWMGIARNRYPGWILEGVASEHVIREYVDTINLSSNRERVDESDFLGS